MDYESYVYGPGWVEIQGAIFGGYIMTDKNVTDINVPEMNEVDIRKRLKVPVESLRRYCRPDELVCVTSRETEPLNDFIGQERAFKAMHFGVSMRAPGYNIFVAGPPGTGKSTYVNLVLKEIAQMGRVPEDWCYLYNFDEPDRPLAVSLPAGRGADFQRDMGEMVKQLRTSIPKAFEGSDYEQKRAALTQEMDFQIDGAIKELKQEAAEADFALKQSPEGFLFLPMKEGKRLSPEDYDALPREVQEEMENRTKVLRMKLEDAMAVARQVERATRDRLQELDKEIVLFAAAPPVEAAKKKYTEFKSLVKFLNQVMEDLQKNLELLKPDADTGSDVDGGIIFNRYRVNLFVNNKETAGAPVVFENSPNYYNLFGKIEYHSRMGNLGTDHTMIKTGALQRANGGFLVLQASDVLMDPVVWETLKRAIKNRSAVVENIGEQFRMVPTVSPRPQSVPLDVKVILVGSYQVYSLLFDADEDFQKFFKVKVEFDTEMKRSSESLSHYAGFVGSVCSRENLPHFDCTGLAELIEHGSRLAGSQDKLSTEFNDVIAIVYEACALAEGEKMDLVGAPHVKRAIEERIYRSSRVEEKMQEMFEEGKTLVSTQGRAVGQINGLSVYDMGDYSFGRPSRITAQTCIGRSGVVNIEREINLSGSIHSKGVLTLSGYLGGTFGQRFPLSLSASITFEQQYGGVDGDSASSAELYALLSSLSGVPLLQCLAVTGSVNQMGEIQPIGGVTEKIEGFYSVCKARGLTGEQGVVMPVQNIGDLMLKHEVVQAVAENKFHIYAVSTVEEGVELLTGLPGGARGQSGLYPEGCLYQLVEKRLEAYARSLALFS